MDRLCFSTLQRVEIAEIGERRRTNGSPPRFSTLQRVEIAEIRDVGRRLPPTAEFQYSSTSRNC